MFLKPYGPDAASVTPTFAGDEFIRFCLERQLDDDDEEEEDEEEDEIASSDEEER